MNFLEGGLFSSPSGIQFQGAGVAVPLETVAGGQVAAPPLPEDAGWSFPHAALAARLNQPVVLGVRPEDVLLREPCDGSSDRNVPDGPIAAARARVSLVEPLGDASLIHLEVEGGDTFSLKLISKAEARTAARAGQLREVVFRAGRIHLFDQNTGESLARV
jgi:ABC-type sugar transport system ATPase subunit